MKRIVWAVVGSMALAVGCEVNQPYLASDFVKSQEVSASQGGTITVTAADSAVLAGTQVVIPPNALAADTRITIGFGGGVSKEWSNQPVSGLLAPTGGQQAGPIVYFGPDRISFATPVTVTLPFTASSSASQSRLVVDALESGGTSYQIAHSLLTIGPTTLSFPVNGFTQFGADYLPPPDDDGGIPNDGGAPDDGGVDAGCGAGLTLCPDDAGVSCVDTTSDQANCGSCGHACTLGFCAGGSCVLDQVDAGGNDGGSEMDGGCFADQSSCSFDTDCCSGHCVGNAEAGSFCVEIDGGAQPDGGTSDGGDQSDGGGGWDGGALCDAGVILDQFGGPGATFTLSFDAIASTLQVYLDGVPPAWVDPEHQEGAEIQALNPNGSFNFTYAASSNNLVLNPDNITLGNSDTLYVAYTPSCGAPLCTATSCTSNFQCCSGWCTGAGVGHCATDVPKTPSDWGTGFCIANDDATSSLAPCCTHSAASTFDGGVNDGGYDAGGVYVCAPAANCTADYFGSCNVNSDCCSGYCYGGLAGDGGSTGTCYPLCSYAAGAGESCSVAGDCCSYSCSADPDAGTPGTCQLSCTPPGQYCQDDVQCCVGFCSTGLLDSTYTCIATLADAGPRCVWDNQACSQDSDCCSRNCYGANDGGGGTCTEWVYGFDGGGSALPCLSENSIYDGDAGCCSGSAIVLDSGVQVCVGEACLPENAGCYNDYDCCSTYCLGWDGGSGGTCLPLQWRTCLGGSDYCSQDSDCCSGTCISPDAGPDAGSQCAYESFCLPDPSPCYQNGDCCGGLCVSDGDGGLACQTPDGG
jgi:hypothetical protein